jgi:hypothetical protein
MTTEPLATVCRETRQLMGLVVLGVAEPEEQERVRSHSAACPDCASTLDELTPLPDLLSTVDAEHAAAGLPEPRPELLRRIIAETRTELETARRRRRRVVAAVGAVGVAAASTLLAVNLWAGGPDRTDTGNPILVASTSDPTTHVHGWFTVTDRGSGSEIHVSLSGVTPGERCRLIAENFAGSREVAGWWVAEYDGRAAVTGHTSMPAQDISQLSVVTESGRSLLVVPRDQLTAVD